MSSYQVLARKWRPRNFSQFVGQSYTIRALTHALASGRLHHAYLFSGTRGVGKTTLARILAAALNCETGITPNPCGQCPTCQAIEQGHFPDLIEVDAASNTKVEDTRTLLDNIPYAPTIGRYKIYLIDEVHMLSQHSFNALLKTLEEPPAHVIFILATTEPERLPITILSRCLQFQLQHIPVLDIQQQLHHILESEKIPFEANSLTPIAIAAQGSLRDALSLLERAIAISEGKLTYAEVNQWLGLASTEQALAILEALAEKNAAQLIDKIQDAIQNGVSGEALLNKLLEILHTIALYQAVPNYPLTSHSTAVMSLAQRFDPEMVQLLYQIALIGKQDLPLSPDPTTGLNMIAIRMLAFYPQTNEPPKTIPSHPIASTPQPPPISVPPKVPAEAEKKPVAQTTSAAQIPQKTKEFSADNWANLLTQLPLSGLVRMIAENSLCLSWQDNHIHLELDSAQRPILNESRQKALQQTLTDYAGVPITLKITIGEVGDATPLKQTQQKQAAARDLLQAQAMADPTVQAVMNHFNATIESIEPIKSGD